MSNINLGNITPERIAELRAAHEATSFPWCVEGCTVFLDAAYIYSHGPVSVCSANGANNAKTIAAARNALPGLLDEIERLQAKVDQLRSGICSECGTVRARAIEAVLGGDVACCPDCSTLSVDDRNTLRVQFGILHEELSLQTHKTITCGVAATHPDKDLTRTKECYAKTWNSPQADAVRALRDDRDRLRDEVERLRRYAPDPFDESMPTYAAMVQRLADAEGEIERLRALLPKAFEEGFLWTTDAYAVDNSVHDPDEYRDTWVAKALEGISHASQPPAGSP